MRGWVTALLSAGTWILWLTAPRVRGLPATVVRDYGSIMRISGTALVISFIASPLAAAVAPFDFTGHWSGHASQQGVTAPAFADFAGTGTFTGTVAVDLGEHIVCTGDGKQKKRIAIIKVTCSNGSAAKLRGRIDAVARTLTGGYGTHRPGHHPRHGKFMLSSPGACVPTAGDCTDPTTGGGEASVCCGGDCQRVVNPDSSESHVCS
jgi:hypothetical protein